MVSIRIILLLFFLVAPPESGATAITAAADLHAYISPRLTNQSPLTGWATASNQQGHSITSLSVVNDKTLFESQQISRFMAEFEGLRVNDRTPKTMTAARLPRQPLRELQGRDWIKEVVAEAIEKVKESPEVRQNLIEWKEGFDSILGTKQAAQDTGGQPPPPGEQSTPWRDSPSATNAMTINNNQALNLNLINIWKERITHPATISLLIFLTVVVLIIKLIRRLFSDQRAATNKRLRRRLNRYSIRNRY